LLQLLQQRFAMIIAVVVVGWRSRYFVGRCCLLLELSLQVLRLLRCRRLRLAGGRRGLRRRRASGPGLVGYRPLLRFWFGSRRPCGRPIARRHCRARPFLRRHCSDRPRAWRFRLVRNEPPILGSTVASHRGGQVCESEHGTKNGWIRDDRGSSVVAKYFQGNTVFSPDWRMDTMVRALPMPTHLEPMTSSATVSLS
jgi:hypothetical protein